MIKEQWKAIKGYEKEYEVSNYGRIRSFPRNGTQDKLPHILAHSVSKDGRHRVTLFKNNIPRYCSVHRLVADAFLEKQYGQTEVNHIDGNPGNNLVPNLEWCTRSENHLHRVYTLNKNALRKCKKVKCLETGVVYDSVRAAARSLICDHKSISRAANGIYATAVGMHWQYIQYNYKENENEKDK